MNIILHETFSHRFDGTGSCKKPEIRDRHFLRKINDLGLKLQSTEKPFSHISGEISYAFFI